MKKIYFIHINDKPVKIKNCELKIQILSGEKKTPELKCSVTLVENPNKNFNVFVSGQFPNLLIKFTQKDYFFKKKTYKVIKMLLLEKENLVEVDKEKLQEFL